MSNENTLVAQMTIDVKRYRFRIFKETLKHIGSPLFVQFLVNPEQLYIAVLGLDKPVVSETVKKVNMVHLDYRNKASNEFYSGKLMHEIIDIFGHLSLHCSYHLFGDVDKVNRVAYFYLSTLKKNERQSSYNEQRVRET